MSRPVAATESQWFSAVLRSLPSTLLLLGLAWIIYQAVPHQQFEKWHNGLLAVGLVGGLRYLWLLTNQLRAIRYLNYRFPALRAAEKALAVRYPKRLYVVVPSYREDPLVTQRCVSALAREVSTLPSEVHLLFSVASSEEMELIHALMRQHGRDEHLKVSFLFQKDGKRMALGQALRATSREFSRVRDWHPDARNDIVVLMDGDTELQADALRNSLGFFRLLPDLGALTTHEEGHMIGKEVQESLLKPWFDLKFAKRHTMMSSHALSGRVLTLTGRFSVFRAGPILDPEFISRVESDYVYHWVFGRFKLLMGDDKSTWFDLLSHGWRMLYLPDVRVNCLETRGGDFFNVSRGLMFRWFGNMARNNGRALRLGPWRMPWFIWLCLLDQRISMWTSLIGPSVAIFSWFMLGWSVFAVYGVWVLVTRLLYLWLLVPRGFVIRPAHIGLQIYDQWVGSATKVAAMMMQNRQSWSKADNERSGEGSARSQLSLRNQLAWLRLVFAVFCFLILMLMFAGAIRFPGQLHLLPVAHADTPSVAVDARNVGVFADDGRDNGPALQALLDRPDVRHIILPAGRIHLDQPLILRRSGVRLSGAGPGLTRLIGRWDNKAHLADQAILQLRGEKGRVLGRLTRPVMAGEQRLPLRWVAGAQPSTEGWFHFEADNSPEFLDALHATVWRQARPPVRQWIGHVRLATDGTGDCLLDRPLLIDLPAGTQVSQMRPLSQVELSGFSIEHEIAGADLRDVDFVYENRFPDHAIDSLRLDWVVATTLSDLEILAAGRHPLVLEHTAEVAVNKVRIAGAWNKGKEGNGYLRLARTFHATLSALEVRDIRHVAFQWSSSGNLLQDSVLTVDVNFHGGFASHNTVRRTRIEPPAAHPWGQVTRTPENARWAPPDGPGNVVD